MKFWKVVTITSTLVLSTSANAALIERLGGLAYYDDVADLTWLADANAAGVAMNWADANAWAAGLTVGGDDRWRLANTFSAIDAYNSDSEMGNLFYNVLGGSAEISITTTHNANYDLFSNIQSYSYWLATEYAPNPSLGAYAYGMGSGYEGLANNNSLEFYAWAVVSGEVMVAPVPVPAAVWLFGSGLIGLAGFARRKNT